MEKRRCPLFLTAIGRSVRRASIGTGMRRTRSSENKEIEIDENQDKSGQCIGPTLRGSAYGYDHNCTDWKKWGVLR